MNIRVKLLRQYIDKNQIRIFLKCFLLFCFYKSVVIVQPLHHYQQLAKAVHRLFSHNKKMLEYLDFLVVVTFEVSKECMRNDLSFQSMVVSWEN